MAGQDYPKRLEAGATQNVNIAGDYIFCKFADRPFTVIMDGSRVTMEGGDKYRNSGGFTEFEIENTDPLNPIAIILTIGQGDYNRQIVKGEITTVTGVRKADGRFVDDSRVSLSMNINPVYGYLGEQISAGDVLGSTSMFKTGNYASSHFKDMDLYNGQLYLLVNSSEYNPQRTAILVFNSSLQDFTVLRPPFAVENTEYLGVFCNVPELPGGYAYTRNTGIYCWSEAENSNELLFSVPDAIGGIMYDAGVLTVITSIGALGLKTKAYQYKIDSGTAVFYKQIDLDHIAYSEHITYDPIGKRYTFGRNTANGSNNVQVTDQNFNIIKTYALQVGGSISGGNSNYWLNVGDEFFGFHAQTDDAFYKLAAVDSTLTLRGFASSVGCDVSLIDPAYDSFATTADLELTREFGQLKASGQLIKAALELYYRKPLGESYMDNIYDVTIYQPITGAVLESIGGRSITLAALEVEDNFSAYFPSRLDITIDSKLPFIKGF
jgi:hypothetical protein